MFEASPEFALIVGDCIGRTYLTLCDSIELVTVSPQTPVILNLYEPDFEGLYVYDVSAVVSSSVYAPSFSETSTRYLPSICAPSPVHDTLIDERSSDTTGVSTPVTVGAVPASL